MALFQKPAIGLDISDQTIEAVFIVKRGGRLVLASYGRAALPPGLVVDGFVERREELSVILRKLLADQMTPPLPNGLRHVVFALSKSQIYSHIFEVPRVADEFELARSLAFEADGYFPYNHQELTSGMTVINMRPEKKEIYYAAVHTETLKSFLSLFAMSGLQPLAVESESASIARAMLVSGEPDPVLFIDIGGRVTNLSVFDRNGTQFSESLATAGDVFSATLARALAISLEDAESLKQHQGISGELDLKAQRMLKAEIDRLLGDVKAAIAYYEERTKRLIKRIIICGGSIQMPGLLEYLSANLSSPLRNFHVQMADPWFDLEVDPLLERLGVRGRGVLITTAIGLGLRGAGIQKFSEIDFLANISPVAPVRQAHPTSRRPPPSSMQPAFKPKSAGLASRSHWLKIGIVAAGVLVAAVGLWLAAFRLVPFIKAKLAPHPSPPAQVQPTAIPLDVKMTIGDTFSADDAKIEGRPIEADMQISKSVAHAATEADGLATGKLRIINKAKAGQTLVPRTRMLSENGVLFRLNDRVFVPAGQTVTVTVNADAPGASGDVGPSRFTIPGLSPALQAQIYGESDAAMTGGAVYTGSPLTQDELSKDVLVVSDGAAADLAKQAKGKADKGQIVIQGLFSVDGADVISGPEVGKPTSDFNLVVKVKATQLTFSQDQVRQALTAALKKKLPGRTGVETYDLGDNTYEVTNFDAGKGQATIIVHTTARKK